MTARRRSAALEDLRELGQYLVDQASPETARLVARRALATHRPPMRGRRWVVVLTASALLSTSTVALGTVADSAAPGDLLYAIDRGLETVGSIFGTGDHSSERIDEAELLAARGELSGAVLALAEAVETHDLATAQELVLASGELSGAETSAAIEGLVADLVADARHVAAAAQRGDHDALKAAIAAMHDRTDELTTGADPSGLPRDNPSVTAPGPNNGTGSGSNESSDNPSDTAPGLNNGTGSGSNESSDNPSDTAPGQNKDKHTDNTSVTAPGQTNGAGNGHGNGQP